MLLAHFGNWIALLLRKKLIHSLVVSTFEIEYWSSSFRFNNICKRKYLLQSQRTVFGGPDSTMLLTSAIELKTTSINLFCLSKFSFILICWWLRNHFLGIWFKCLEVRVLMNGIENIQQILARAVECGGAERRRRPTT